MVSRFLLLLLCVSGPTLVAQTFPTDDAVIRRIWAEAMDSSQLPLLAHELFDVIGPRLVGSPGMQKAHDWAVDQYRSWGIEAENQQYGTWRGWERGITHIDLLKPRVRTLEGTMLAFSPGTRAGGVTGGIVAFPDIQDSAAFQRWLPQARGKFVLLSMPHLTGRPDKNWEEFARKESFDSLKARRKRIEENWETRLKATGIRQDSLPMVLEQAGAIGVVTSVWSSGWGTYRVFDTRATRIPAVTLSLEDYNLLYRLVEHGDDPILRVEAEARFLGPQLAYNTIGRIRGKAHPDEYVMLSAHFDSWDAASGATDNGTGTLIMMEALRILKKVHPAPSRTIAAGHWGSEEQGLNGSRAFAKDHPEIVDRMQALFNQDNGTGRIVSMSAAGLVDAGGFLARWLSRIPTEITRDLRVAFPGMPSNGGTDNAAFAPYGAPAFGLGSLNWDYFAYTWHTNRDSYDKLVFDDLKQNVVLVACLAYLAAEDPERVPRERRLMPLDPKTGKPQEWPKPEDANRDGRPQESRRSF